MSSASSDDSPRTPPLDPELQSIIEEFEGYQANYLILSPPPSPSLVHLEICNDTPNSLSFTERPRLSRPKVNPNNTKYYTRNAGGWIEVHPSLIRNLIVQPEQAGPPFQELWMQLEGSDTLRPAYLPNISDVVSIFVKDGRELREWVYLVPASCSLVVLDRLLYVIDPAPCLPPLRTSYAMKSHLTMYFDSYTNDLFIGHFTEPRHSLAFIMNPLAIPCKIDSSADNASSASRWKWTTEIVLAPLTSRQYFDFNAAEVVAKPRRRTRGGGKPTRRSSLPDDLLLVTWNARGIARPSFDTSLAHLLQSHNLDVLLNSETRTTVDNAHFILCGLEGVDNNWVAAPYGLTGGLLVVWNSAKVHFSSIGNDHQCVL